MRLILGKTYMDRIPCHFPFHAALSICVPVPFMMGDPPICTSRSHPLQNRPELGQITLQRCYSHRIPLAARLFGFRVLSLFLHCRIALYLVYGTPTPEMASTNKLPPSAICEKDGFLYLHQVEKKNLKMFYCVSSGEGRMIAST